MPYAYLIVISFDVSFLSLSMSTSALVVRAFVTVRNCAARYCPMRFICVVTSARFCPASLCLATSADPITI